LLPSSPRRGDDLSLNSNEYGSNGPSGSHSGPSGTLACSISSHLLFVSSRELLLFITFFFDLHF
jgi:hypothetical protein